MVIDIKEYSHFSFDLWLTLIKSNTFYKKKRDCLFRDFFKVDRNVEIVSQTIRKHDLLCNKISEKTGVHICFYEIYYLILSELNRDISSIGLEDLNEFYDLSEKLFFDNMPELIDSKVQILFKNIKSESKTISLLSNTAFIKGSTLRKVISYYELSEYFSFQLYSDEIGFSKPTSRVFESVFDKACQLQALSKTDIVHIGDNKYADFDGAIQYGFKAILI